MTMKNKEKRHSTVNILEGSTESAVIPRGLYIRTKMSDAYNAKRQIAILVANKYVEDFDAVLLDAGSTGEIIAEEIFSRRKFLSVLTNNMGAYAAFTRAGEIGQPEKKQEEGPSNRGNELIITGGRYVDIYESLLGEGARSSIRIFTPNISIIGTSGLVFEEGIFCHGSEEAAVKHDILAKPVDIRLVATDWTKIGKRDAHSFGGVNELTINAQVSVVVTSEPPKALYDTESDRIKEFDNQIKQMEKAGIVVERVTIPESKQIEQGK
jgi:DeoR/GlpR family transcriptional regulator of sugar metabolism